jgi:hypothetical protein
MLQGSCLCRQVRYELHAQLQFINHCHCSMCRKAHGAAFGTFVHGDGHAFRWISGSHLIEHFESSPGNMRAFCRVCGSNMPVVEDQGAHVIIPAGTLDTDPGMEPVVHIHVGSKAPWYRITDTLPQFDEDAPQTFWAAVEAGPR